MSTIQKTTLKRFNGTDWDPIHLATSADITRVGADITVIGSAIGALAVGDTIKATDSVQAALKKIVQKRVPPVYTQPAIALAVATGTAKGSYEAGTAIKATIRSTFTQNDAGALTDNSIKKNDTAVVTGTDNPADYVFDATLGDETVTFGSTATYAEGAVKKDSLDDPSPNGHVAAGSKNSANIQYVGFRKAFYGADSVGEQAALATSAAIRALSATSGAANKGQVITASIPAGSTRFTLAFKASLGNLAEVLYKESGNANVTSQFKKTTVDVEGANGFDAVAYNVYTISWAQPTAGAMTFTIKL